MVASQALLFGANAGHFALELLLGFSNRLAALFQMTSFLGKQVLLGGEFFRPALQGDPF